MVQLSHLVDIFLQPGEYFVGNADFQIRTMLGSCVSITLWDPIKRIGAMSHFLLPKRTYTTEPIRHLDARYGDEALLLMLGELAQVGVSPAQCQGKIFGGGNMFPGHRSAGSMQIGQRNGEAARALLRDRGIPIVSESLFGIGHRQIIFDVSTGDVWSRQVRLSTEET
ncbi:MAG: chemotaxis protein CheD [Burkholderiaceae bacterium]|nr:chemotaxis protein CheD [Burkholderiaceae bacterium]